MTDRGRLLFDRAQVVEWAATRGLATRAGFLTPQTSAFATGCQIEPLLRAGAIWRERPGCGGAQCPGKSGCRIAGGDPPIRQLLTQRLRTVGGITWAAVGGGFALPHPSARVALGRESGTVALLLLRDGLAQAGPTPDDMPVTRLFFFIAPSPRAHLDLIGRLTRALSQDNFRDLIVKGAGDAEIFAAAAATDAAAASRKQTGGKTMTAGALLFLAATGLVGGMVSGPRFARLWLTLTLVGVVAGLGAALLVLGNGADWQWRSGFLVGGETLHFRLDALSAIFLVLLSIVGGAGAVYARGYWPDQNYPSSAPRGRLWWCGLVLSMGLVLVSSNGLHFLIAWEMFTVCAFFLITMDPRRGEARKAGWLFLVSSHAGTVCLFAFFGTLAERAGSWDLGPMREQADSAPLFWLALAGFGVKAGMFPLHIWLPSAHANAPSHVSAIMSGVALKMGIYGILRFSGWMPVPMAAGWVVMGLGAASALIGIAFALAQNDLKRLLAYCSVENIGIDPCWHRRGAASRGPWQCAVGPSGAGWRVVACVESWRIQAAAVCFGAGSVLHATGTREMAAWEGCGERCRGRQACLRSEQIAVCGLPPLNGFVSEWLL